MHGWTFGIFKDDEPLYMAWEGPHGQILVQHLETGECWFWKDSPLGDQPEPTF